MSTPTLTDRKRPGEGFFVVSLTVRHEPRRSGPLVAARRSRTFPSMARRKKRKKTLREADSSPELTGLARLLVESPVEVLDLHGMTADQAERRLGFFFERHLLTSPGRVVHVITGKGAGSLGAAVLPTLVRELLESDFSGAVAEWGGLPGGGGVAARIRGE